LKRATVIVATLGRPSLLRTLDCIKAQTMPGRGKDWFLFSWTGGVNEYVARNQATEASPEVEVFAFTDDDAEPPPDWLENGVRHFEEDPQLMLLTGPIEGDMWGQGWMKLDKAMWFVGANIMVRRSAFEKVGGFDATWGLNPPPRGWRGDTDLGLRIIKEFGEKAYGHFPDVRMVHPKSMQSQWDQRVEAEFYKRWRQFCLENFAPVDPRMCQFVVQQGVETAPEIVEYLNWLNDRFFGKARPRAGAFYACYHCDNDFHTLENYRQHLRMNGLSTNEIPQDGIKWWVPDFCQNYVPLEPHEKNILAWMKKALAASSFPPNELRRTVTVLPGVESFPRGTFIDVGAERGLYAISLARYFERVWAVEPYSDYLVSLGRTKELNGLKDKVNASAAAAWDHDGMVNLGLYDINKKAEFSASETEQGIQVVPAVTVDSLGVKDCRLLKVDAEGQGVKVLRGAIETLQRTEMVLFEIHELGGDMEESTVGRSFLDNCGFKRTAQWFQHGATHELWTKGANKPSP